MHNRQRGRASDHVWGRMGCMEKWLECTISPGQFAGEFAVKAKTFNSKEVSLFASKEDLQFDRERMSDRPVPGFIRVVPEDQKDDLLLISLPKPTFENGHTITVKNTQLRESK